MPLDLPPTSSLRAFSSAARWLSFKRAADELHLSPSALSRQIRQLEETLGAPLLRRHSRRVELTPAGAALRDRIEPILRSLRGIPAELRALAAGQVGQVRVGFTGLAMATVLPAILREFQREYPYGWLGILAAVPPSSDELIYAHTERGFALLSMRSPELSRLYL